VLARRRSRAWFSLIVTLEVTITDTHHRHSVPPRQAEQIPSSPIGSPHHAHFASPTTKHGAV
jgi:hypothetical protein